MNELYWIELLVLDNNTWNSEYVCIEILAHLKMKLPINYVCKQMTDVKLWLLYNNTWNHLTVCKKWAQTCLRMLSTKMCLQIIYPIYMYDEDLA